jgi:hypothetical protein
MPFRLTKTSLKKVRESKRLRNRLQFELDVSSDTVRRWVRCNNEMLTTAHSLAIISDETGLATDALIEKYNN